MKPRIRVAHANPTLGKSDCSIRGKMMPPREPPAAARPVALPRLRRKKWPMALMEGVKIREVPVPPTMPITSMKCQYSFVCLVSIDFLGFLQGGMEWERSGREKTYSYTTPTEKQKG